MKLVDKVRKRNHDRQPVLDRHIGNDTITFALFTKAKYIPDARIGYFMDITGAAIFPFLRCFGKKISKVRVYGTDSFVNQYINQFCADTLTNIDFYESRRKQFSAKNFSKPFKLVNEIVIKSDAPNLGKRFPSFVQWFPNVRRMNICAASFDKDFEAASFPHLECLCIWSDIDGPGVDNLEQHVEHLLQANRRLHTVKLLNSDSTFSKALDMISGNTTIEEFEWSSKQIGHVYTDELLRLANEHPNIIDLKMSNQFLQFNDAIILVSCLHYLKSIEFQIKRSEYTRFREQLQYVTNFDCINYYYSLDPDYLIVTLKFKR